jgi:hypothetical protein
MRYGWKVSGTLLRDALVNCGHVLSLSWQGEITSQLTFGVSGDQRCKWRAGPVLSVTKELEELPWLLGENHGIVVVQAG